MTDQMTSDDILYQLTTVTQPGLARYRAIVQRHIRQDLSESRTEEISRLDEYGQLSPCMKDAMAHVQKYCVCRFKCDRELDGEAQKYCPQ